MNTLFNRGTKLTSVQGQSILQKMALAPTAIPEASIKAIAQKAKGSLRDFVNDVVFDALKLGGVLPQ